MKTDPSPVSDSRLELVDRLFAGTGATYDSMVHWATFGIDRLWKRRMLESIPEGNGPVLDLACGTGISTLSIARRFPHRPVVGVELRDEYLRFAREKVRREGIDNVELVLCRAEDFRSATRFDCITSSYLAKYADLPLLTRNCRDMLRPEGVLMMHDFTYPPKPALVAVWRLYFTVMKHTVARAFPTWQEIYQGLPRLIEETQWLSSLQDALARNRFSDVKLEYLTLYGSAIVRAVKPAGEGDDDARRFSEKPATTPQPRA
ncbi:MAG TPA: class I SAM-dependent methyltransferase [Lautropia sp.]|nr:class I SAM-dependent methyltransferase [Lautropia sp.]